MVKNLIVFFSGFLLSFSLHAFVAPDSANSIETDQGKIIIRKFDTDKVGEFRDDPDFQYKAIKREGLTWWDRLKIAILEFIARLFYLATSTILGRIIFYTLCAVLIIFFIIRFLNIDIKETFYRTAKSGSPKLSHEEENIHEISFEERINEAYRRKNLRECVRLTFLHALKKLADKQAIAWRPGKTNDEYWRELNHHPARQPWQELRLYFDYTWYGHFDVDENIYSEIQTVFEDFNRKVS
ncbi:MAG TPA: DUF4129 domain-containing protein [Cyclobacteriaceae bacterium]|nr:DUF4129 domain-containing protein [Cyclobacteriaceae bacterium]